MNEQTEQILKRLEQADWFANVKSPLSDDVVRIDTWMEALQLCTAGWWEMVGHDRGTQLHDAVLAADPSAEPRWKEVEEELAPKCRASVHGKLEGIRSRRPIPRDTEMIIGYHIRYACLETEFADIAPLGYFSSLITWYERGHFPCGEDEDGNLVVL